MEIRPFLYPPCLQYASVLGTCNILTRVKSYQMMILALTSRITTKSMHPTTHQQLHIQSVKICFWDTAPLLRSFIGSLTCAIRWMILFYLRRLRRPCRLGFERLEPCKTSGWRKADGQICLAPFQKCAHARTFFQCQARHGHRDLNNFFIYFLLSVDYDTIYKTGWS